MKKPEFCPKLYIVPSREDLLERYCDKYTERIERCYQDDWDTYVAVCRKFLEGRYTNDLKVLMIDGIEPIPKDLNKRFTAYEKSEYCQYLFRHAVCMDANDQIIGKTIEFELPVSFKLYIKKERWDRLANQGMPKTFCVKDFNSIRDICIQGIKSKMNPYGFDVRPIDEGVQNNFRFFTLNLIQKRKYNKSEDLLIRGKRDREMSIVKNYKPNKMFFRKQSLFAIENNRSQEVFGTLGLVLLGSIVGGAAFGIDKAYNKHEERLRMIQNSTKYFSPEEVEKLDEYISKLANDIDKIETEFIKYCDLQKFKDDVDIYIEDDIRKRDIVEQRMDLYKNEINANDNIHIRLNYIIELKDGSHNDATFVSGNTNNLNGIYKRAEEFVNKKTAYIGMSKSKSKIVSLYENATVTYGDKNEYSRILEIEPPKEIKELIRNVRERYHGSDEYQSNEAFDSLMNCVHINDIKKDKHYDENCKKIDEWLNKNNLKSCSLSDINETVKKMNPKFVFSKDLVIQKIDGRSYMYNRSLSSARAKLGLTYGNVASALYNKMHKKMVSNVYACGIDDKGNFKQMKPALYNIYVYDKELQDKKRHNATSKNIEEE